MSTSLFRFPFFLCVLPRRIAIHAAAGGKETESRAVRPAPDQVMRCIRRVLPLSGQHHFRTNLAAVGAES